MICILVLTSTGSLLVYIQGQRQADMRELLQKADAERDKGQIKRSNDLYRKVLALDPD